MAGSARYIDKGNPPDSRFNQFGNIATNNVFAESNAKNISTKNNNYITTRQGIFTGAFGSSESNLTIESGGILDITQNTTGDVPIRRTIHINPFSGTTDTLIGIETDANELPYQELFLIGVAGDTITITHNSGSVSGTERAILCAGDTDYTLSGDEIVHLIYDTSLTKWIVLNSSSAGDDLGNHTATQNLDLDGNQLLLSTDQTSKISTTGNTVLHLAGGSEVFRITSTQMVIQKTFSTKGDTTLGDSSVDNITFNGTMNSSIKMNGKNIELDADNDTTIDSLTDDTIKFTTSGTLRLQIDNSLVFANQDIGIITGSKLKGFFGVIGLQVSSSSLTVGSAGSLQIPYLSDTTTYSTGVNATLDGIFGDLNGCVGIQYNSTSPTYTFWCRLNGGWRRNFLT